MSQSTADRSERLLEQLLAATPDHPVRFKRLCEDVEDWDGVFNAALQHGVESFLYRFLTETGYQLPGEVQERTERWLMIRDAWQTHSAQALDETLRALHAADVKAVALKGPVLAERLYSNPRVRPSADLDLLVAPSDFNRATSALAAVGYRPQNESQDRFLRKYHYHTILSRSCPPVIELHFRLSHGFGTKIPAEQFLSRARVHRTERGAVVHVLSPEDEMIYLSVHAAGHHFLRLSWLCDIKLLLSRYPDLDWKTVAARAASFKVRAAVLFTCETLRRRLGVDIPELHPANRIRSQVATFLLEAIKKQPDCSRRLFAGEIAFTTILCDTPLSAIGFLKRPLFLILRRRARRHLPSLVPEEWSY